jgi:hypothetical protein
MLNSPLGVGGPGVLAPGDPSAALTQLHTLQELASDI